MKRKIMMAATAVTLLLGVTACNGKHNSTANNLQNGQQSLTEQAFQKQQTAEPYPLAEIDDSTERANLIRRLIEFNDPNKIGYVYLFNFGKVVGYYVIKGKVSSNDSQLTSAQLVQRYCTSCSGGGNNAVVDGPQDDGSYGGSEPGEFFFTTSNIMVETDLDYEYADDPLPINVPLLGGDKNATENPQQAAAAAQAECRAVGKAAGINLPAGADCTAADLAKLAPHKDNGTQP